MYSRTNFNPYAETPHYNPSDFKHLLGPPPPDLRQRLHTVIHRYQALALQYQGLSLATRREIKLSKPHLRFFCAAILQQPLISHGNHRLSEAIGYNEIYEMCPLWVSWYSQLNDFMIDLQQLESAYTFTETHLNNAKELLVLAEDQIDRLERGTAEIIESTSNTADDRSDQEVVEDWNSICADISLSNNIDEAIRNFNNRKRIAVPSEEYERKYFVYTPINQAQWESYFPETTNPELKERRRREEERQQQQQQQSSFGEGPQGQAGGSRYSHTRGAYPGTNARSRGRGGRRWHYSDRQYHQHAAFGRDNRAFPPLQSLQSIQPDNASYKFALEKYNNAWSELAPEASINDVPMPSMDLKLSPLSNPRSLDTTKLRKTYRLTREEIMKFNVECFFLRAFGAAHYIGERDGKAVVYLQAAIADEGKTALLKQLKRKEALRWHPDKINGRTGKKGEMNEALGKANYVVAIRSAVQEVIEMFE